MGIGDDIIATGIAKGAAARGERIAFGNGKKIIWGPYSEMIFRNNPNVAKPGEEAKHIKWFHYYKGNRIYNMAGNGRWLWNYAFKVQPGEIYFDQNEYRKPDEKLIIIEPNVPKKPCAPNKTWPHWHLLANELRGAGW